MLKVAGLSVIILLFCFVLCSIRILVKKNGTFPDTHVGGNPALRQKGIKCARAQDFEAGIRKNLFERMG
jgi:hypothetical protein